VSRSRLERRIGAANFKRTPHRRPRCGVIGARSVNARDVPELSFEHWEFFGHLSLDIGHFPWGKLWAMRYGIALLLILVLTPSATAADWPQWRGPERTGYVTVGAPVPTNLPAEPKILWRIKIGDGFASPIVSGDKVLYSDNSDEQETVHALSPSDGKVLWHAAIDQAVGDHQGPAGPRCTPLVNDGRVYAQSMKGRLRCFSASDGKPIWETSFTTDFSAIFIGEKGNAQGASRHGNDGSPLIEGERLFANVGGTNGESEVCFEKATGKVIWKSQNDQAGYAAPVMATIDGTRQVIVFTADGVIGLGRNDGKLLWRYPMKTTYARHVTTPVVFENIVVVSSHQIGLVGIKITRADDNWQATQCWLSKDSTMNISSPVAVGECLYGLGPSQDFVCVEIKTGKQMWSKDGYITGAGDHAHAAFIVMGLNILALTDGGQLVLFAADPHEFKEKGTAQVCGRTFCNPAYADGKLYLRDAHELMCVKLVGE
jgi:outer membrane protein assembly factor BamB